jgi:hypothetical protein
MSNDGAYVFFDTADALVPQDTNGTLDVYEWHGGKISLISSGTDPSPSFLLSSSADGANAFFGTHARLVAADVDTAGDLYDARIGGGFAAPGSASSCASDECSTPALAPVDSTPASLTFVGSGNGSGKAASSGARPTRAQLLARALAACRRGPRKARPACERKARKQYGPRAHAKAGRSGRRGNRKKGRGR